MRISIDVAPLPGPEQAPPTTDGSEMVEEYDIKTNELLGAVHAAAP
jgi:hypothetical protein